jgi:hypothetical protein
MSSERKCGGQQSADSQRIGMLGSTARGPYTPLPKEWMACLPIGMRVACEGRHGVPQGMDGQQTVRQHTPCHTYQTAAIPMSTSARGIAGCKLQHDGRSGKVAGHPTGKPIVISGSHESGRRIIKGGQRVKTARAALGRCGTSKISAGVAWGVGFLRTLPCMAGAPAADAIPATSSMRTLH